MIQALGRDDNSRKEEVAIDQVKDGWQFSRDRAPAKEGGGHVTQGPCTCL